MKDPELVQFGQQLKEIRQELGISQEQFAFESGLSRSYISDVERGARNPTLKKLLLIQRTLGVDIADLFQWVA